MKHLRLNPARTHRGQSETIWIDFLEDLVSREDLKQWAKVDLICYLIKGSRGRIRQKML